MKITCPKLAGIASIPTVLVLMMLLISIGLMIATISLSDMASVGGLNDSNRALDYARSGAKDALQRIVRNKDYTDSYTLEMVTGGCASPYAGCVTVSVSDVSSPKVITAEGQVNQIKRNAQIDVNLDDNGLITSYSWSEL